MSFRGHFSATARLSFSGSEMACGLCGDDAGAVYFLAFEPAQQFGGFVVTEADSLAAALADYSPKWINKFTHQH